MNKPFRFFLILRLAVYTILIAYLAGDFSLNGPLTRGLKRVAPGSPESIARATANQEIARVGEKVFTRSQLDRAISETLFLEGKSLDELSDLDQQIVRYKALSELVDAELLNQQMAAELAAPSVSEPEVNARLARLLGRFVTKTDLETAMKSQGIPDEATLRKRLEIRIRQAKFIDSQIAPQIQVSDEEARSWFDEHRQEMQVPERIRARHLFIPTLDVESDLAKARLESALKILESGTKDFAELASEVSMDPATQFRGGDLGWMTRDRLPEDFSAPLFQLNVGQRAIFQTKLGWHLVEVTGKNDPQVRTFPDARAEIITALQATKRARAVQEFRDNLQKSSGIPIVIRHEILNRKSN